MPLDSQCLSPPIPQLLGLRSLKHTASIHVCQHSYIVSFSDTVLGAQFCPAQTMRRCYISGDAPKPPARCMGPVIALSWFELTQCDSTDVWTPHHNQYISRKRPRAEDSDFNYCWNVCISHVLPSVSHKVKERHTKNAHHSKVADLYQLFEDVRKGSED